jgi:cyclophilin family peptidyl-prolyl cis-trans isomerase
MISIREECSLLLISSLLMFAHRIFGRAIGGLDIIHEIENVKVDKNDKPWEEIKMMSISIE